jgi:hypothetical protein
MARSKRTRLVVAGDTGTAMFAAAADRLDWKVAAAAGAGAAEIKAETRAKVVDLDRVVDSIDADVAVVGTPADRRLADAARLLDRGVGVVLVPDGLGHGQALPTASGRWVLGDPIPMAPAVQRWMQVVQAFGQIDRVWITTTPSRTTSAASLAVLVARIVRWPDPDRVEIQVVDDALPRFEAQAAGPTDAATLTLFPDSRVEHNGDDVSPPPMRHPADAFGATDLLRRFAADLGAGTTPILGADFLRAAQARQLNL